MAEASTRHSRLRGWARTDARGRYRFETIRHGAYPARTDPQDIHMHVIEPRGTYGLDDVVFEDDPLLTPERLTAMRRGRGGPGHSRPGLDAAGMWQVRRDIVLGANIP